MDGEEFCGVLLVDTQPTFRHTVVPDAPAVVAVFDHHRSPPGRGRRARPDARALGRAHRPRRHLVDPLRVPPRHGGPDRPRDGFRALLRRALRHRRPLAARGALDEEAYYEPSAARIVARRRDRPAPTSRSSYYRHVSQALETARQHGPLVLASGRGQEPRARGGDGRLLPAHEGLLVGRRASPSRIVRALAADGLRLQEGLSPHGAMLAGEGSSAATVTSPAGGPLEDAGRTASRASSARSGRTRSR